jgi:tetratricopeptide (TPR) repeat protein
VCDGADQPGDVPLRLSVLVEKSLLRSRRDDEGAVRYSLLETTRLYAAERLAEQADATAVRARHASYFADFAQQANEELRGTGRVAWLHALDVEYANIRAALEWSLENSRRDIAARIGLGLYRFWHNGHHVSESRQWLDRILEASGELAESLLVQVLDNAAWLAIAEGDHVAARRHAMRCIDEARAIGDLAAVAEAFGALGDIDCITGDYAQAHEHYEQALLLRREIGDAAGVAVALGHLGEISFVSGNLDAVLPFSIEALVIERATGHTRAIVQNLTLQGETQLLLGDSDAARSLLDEGLALSRSEGHTAGEANATLGLARVEHLTGQTEPALRAAVAAMRLNQQLGFGVELADSMETLADILASRPEQRQFAVELLGAAEAFRAAHGLPRFPVWQSSWDTTVGTLQDALDGRRFEHAWAAGRAARLDGLVAIALAIDPAAYAE